MPAPGVVAAGIAAARAIGGILGKGSKNVNPVYKNIGEPKSAVKVIKKPGESPNRNLPKPPPRPAQGSLKVVKSSPGNVDRMNSQRTAAGRARELEAARKAEQIRTAKANARLAKIKER
jgi:hypothetical protein